MRQAITAFASSMISNGLVQSRYPSHICQIIPGFALFWVLQVCDHHFFFNDATFIRPFLPQINRVLDYFNSHIDHRGLVSGLPKRYWQFVDWAAQWSRTPDHPDGGVPTQGRASNTHSMFTMLLSYTLSCVSQLAEHLGEPDLARSMITRANNLRDAININCFDGTFYLDSTTDQPFDIYSQHAQVFAVLCGAATGDRAREILLSSFALIDRPSKAEFAKCSYVFMHYAFRAFAKAGGSAYDTLWPVVWDPWRAMLKNNLTTWEEDTVSQRSDCHAWGSVAIYEYLIEVAGVHPTAPGWQAILFWPRLVLSQSIDCQVAMGKDNSAKVGWTRNGQEVRVSLTLARAVRVVSRLPGGDDVEQGVVNRLVLTYVEE